MNWRQKLTLNSKRSWSNSSDCKKVHPPCFDALTYIEKEVKLKDPKFSRMNREIFLDWIQALESYFQWFNLAKGRKIQYATTKLRDPAIMWWRRIQESNRCGKGDMGTCVDSFP